MHVASEGCPQILPISIFPPSSVFSCCFSDKPFDYSTLYICSNKKYTVNNNPRFCTIFGPYTFSVYLSTVFPQTVNRTPSNFRITRLPLLWTVYGFSRSFPYTHLICSSLPPLQCLLLWFHCQKRWSTKTAKSRKYQHTNSNNTCPCKICP